MVTKALVRIGAGSFWLLVLFSPLMMAFSVGQSGPSNVLVAFARSLAAGPGFALYLLGVPEEPAKWAGTAIALALGACAAAELASAARRILGRL